MDAQLMCMLEAPEPQTLETRLCISPPSQIALCFDNTSDGKLLQTQCAFWATWAAACRFGYTLPSQPLVDRVFMSIYLSSLCSLRLLPEPWTSCNGTVRA